jgi:hypothetical protein
MTEPDRLAPGGRAVLTRTLTIAEVPAEGRGVRFSADATERAALAADLGLPEVRQLDADMRVKPWGKSGVEITGTVTAAVVQSCVVTLEPIEQSFVEPIDIRFETAAEAEAIARRRAETAAEAEDDGEDDAPDIFDGHLIPVGAVAEEFFALGLDPYPRKPGVAFSPEELGLTIGDPISINPFAALEALKPKS